MYFSMQALRHVCSLELKLDPGVTMQCSKQFSLTLAIRNLAFSTLPCKTMADWIFCRTALVGVLDDDPNGEPEMAPVDGDEVSSSVGFFDPPPPKNPPKDMVMR